jgi:hypothetical protein
LRAWAVSGEKERKGGEGNWAAAVGWPAGPVVLVGPTADFRELPARAKRKAFDLILKVDLKYCLNLNLIQIQTSLN